VQRPGAVLVFAFIDPLPCRQVQPVDEGGSVRPDVDDETGGGVGALRRAGGVGSGVRVDLAVFVFIIRAQRAVLDRGEPVRLVDGTRVLRRGVGVSGDVDDLRILRHKADLRVAPGAVVSALLVGGISRVVYRLMRHDEDGTAPLLSGDRVQRFLQEIVLVGKVSGGGVGPHLDDGYAVDPVELVDLLAGPLPEAVCVPAVKFVVAHADQGRAHRGIVSPGGRGCVPRKVHGGCFRIRVDNAHQGVVLALASVVRHIAHEYRRVNAADFLEDSVGVAQFFLRFIGIYVDIAADRHPQNGIAAARQLQSARLRRRAPRRGGPRQSRCRKTARGQSFQVAFPVHLLIPFSLAKKFRELLHAKSIMESGRKIRHRSLEKGM